MVQAHNFSYLKRLRQKNHKFKASLDNVRGLSQNKILERLEIYLLECLPSMSEELG